jgi:Tol biopolymer transport system component
LLYPELSPDGALAALLETVENNADVWLLDTVRGGKVRFTYDPSIDNAPVWSPDGQRIVFSSIRRGPYNLFIGPSNRANAEVLLRDSPNNNYAQDWSRDGRFVLYGESGPKTGRDLWALPMTDGDHKPIEIVKTQFDELNGQFSPDGRWVAYETNESGPFQIVVQPFPVASSKSQVSISGGSQPRWSADGKELYFIAPDGKMMAAQVNVSGGTFTASTPVALFQASPVAGAGSNKQQYAVSRDGRFLINQSADSSAATPITLILNWRPEH